MSEVALAKVDVVQKLLQLGHIDPHEVEQGVAIVGVLLQESFEEGTAGCTMGQNRVLGEISFSHVTSSILGVILGICVARNVCYKCVNISN